MNAKQILDDLNRGEVVTIRDSDAFEFMREVQRHSLTSQVIKMTVADGTCDLRSECVDQPRVDQ